MAGLLSMTGCGADPAGSEQAIQQHLKQKYGDIDYQISNYSPYSFSQGYYSMQCYLSNGFTDKFDACYYPAADGKPAHYLDSYYGVAKHQEFEALINPIAATYFKNYRLSTSYEDFPDDVTLDDSVESVIKMGKFTLNHVYVFVPADDFTNGGVFDEGAFDDTVKKFAADWANTCDSSEIDAAAVDASTYQSLVDPGFGAYVFGSAGGLEYQPGNTTKVKARYFSPASTRASQYDPAGAGQ
jgi:hypothetical protein